MDKKTLRTRPQTTETLGQSYEDLKRPQARQNLKSTVHISTVLRTGLLSLVAPEGPADFFHKHCSVRGLLNCEHEPRGGTYWKSADF